MELRLTDPAFLFPGISLLFLAYTNRYLALASIVRQLNQLILNDPDTNRLQQIENLKLRIKLIKYMQMFGVLAFIFCIVTMANLFFGQPRVALWIFSLSLAVMLISLLLALAEIMQSGKTLDLELERTQKVQAETLKSHPPKTNLKDL